MMLVMALLVAMPMVAQSSDCWSHCEDTLGLAIQLDQTSVNRQAWLDCHKACHVEWTRMLWLLGTIRPDWPVISECLVGPSGWYLSQTCVGRACRTVDHACMVWDLDDDCDVDLRDVAVWMRSE